jgi:tetratricopeptide (TPR) repeat protein
MPRKHWLKHKKDCKQRAAELRDEALFKDPPPKEDCPICFLPMSINLICCMSLPPATIMSVPIHDFAIANEEFAKRDTAIYYPCCGKTICGGCIYSFGQSGNVDKCPFCNSDRNGKTDEERVGEIMKRVEANDADSIFLLAGSYYHGKCRLQQDHTKAIELYTKAAGLGSSKAHYNLGVHYYKGGDLKKAKFHYEAAAMAGHEVARTYLGCMEAQYGNMERAVKHLKIGALAGCFHSMHALIKFFQQDCISRESINSILVAYNNCCAEMRSETRDAYNNKVRTIPRIYI